ncbi:hypothetical protein Tco_1252254 [Tanacetum coccineum]
MRSLRCLLHKPLVEDNPTSGRSTSRHSTLEVDRINHQFLEVDNGSPPFAYLIPGIPAVDPTILSFQTELIDNAPVLQVQHQIILTGIDNDIYSTVDACPNAMDMWKVILRLKQGESINVQDLATNLYWEFGKFTSHDGESLESYYSCFYKIMNELVRNQCIVTYHQVNVHFLLQLKPKWQRFVTIVKQSQDLKNFIILNPIPPNYTQSSSTRSHAATRNKGKAIANSPPPTYDIEPEVVTDDDTSSKEKEIDKLMALISMSFKKIYKPTNNNLKSSSNTRNLHVDNTLRTNRGTWYNRQTRQYENQKAVNVAGARENVRSQVVQQSGIQCFNCKECGHVAREFQKLILQKRMLLCKQEKAGIQLSVRQVSFE